MKTLLKALLAALCLATLSAPVLAQFQPRAYAPDDLRELSYNDQVRVISREYEEQSGGRRIPDDQLRFYLDQVNRSDWTFSRIREDIARSLEGGMPGPEGGSAPIRCESNDNRSRSCPTPWPGPSRLVRQLSRTPCREGGNWSTQFGQVSVWSGCRAEFAEDRDVPGPGHGDQFPGIRCESNDNRTRTCPTPWRGRAELLRQLSRSPCVEGHSWNSRDGQVTVWGGCRAEFGPARAPWSGGHGGGYSVTCASERGLYTTCHWPSGQGRPRLLQQLSDAPCIRDRSWGLVDPYTLWVDHGCRARFGR